MFTNKNMHNVIFIVGIKKINTLFQVII